jgi:hypothetical protein
MHHVRFYHEFSDRRKTKSTGNVFAAFVGNGVHVSNGLLCYEGLGALFAQPNSPVAGTSASLDFIRETCKRVSEAKARQIHPALFERLDQES